MRERGRGRGRRLTYIARGVPVACCTDRHSEGRRPERAERDEGFDDPKNLTEVRSFDSSRFVAHGSALLVIGSWNLFGIWVLGFIWDLDIVFLGFQIAGGQILRVLTICSARASGLLMAPIFPGSTKRYILSLFGQFV